MAENRDLNPLSELPHDFDTNFLTQQNENAVKKEELDSSAPPFSTNPWLVETFEEFLYAQCH